MRKVTKAMFAVMSAAAIGLTGGYYVSAQEYDKSGFCPITEGMTSSIRITMRKAARPVCMYFM